MKLIILRSSPINCKAWMRPTASPLLSCRANIDSPTAPPIKRMISTMLMIMHLLLDYQYICTVGSTSFPFSKVS